MTDEQRQAYIKALLEERRGYITTGNSEGINAVEAELARVGADAKPPAKRAAKRVTKAKEER